MDDIANITGTDEDTLSSPSPSSFEFILLLIVEIPAILCVLIILVYLFSNWKIRVKHSLRNHIIQILVIISFLHMTLDLPFTMNSYRLGYDQYRTIPFCQCWYWFDYTLISTSIFLTATASIQRHILIFSAHWLHIRKRKWFLHYLPILFCLIYPAGYYLIFIVLYSCDYSIDNDSLYCFDPCYVSNSILFNYDWIVNIACPLLTIVIANLILIIRVIHSMKRVRREQALTWKRQRKLTRQLLTLSLLYIAGWAPSTCVSIVQTLAQPNLFDDYPQLKYCYYLTYFVCPLQPFVCLIGLPDLRKKFKRKFKHMFTSRRVTPFVQIQS